MQMYNMFCKKQILAVFVEKSFGPRDRREAAEDSEEEN